MIRFLTRRILLTLPSALVVIVLTSVLMRIGADPVGLLMGDGLGVDESQRAAITAKLGLDRSGLDQTVDWLLGLAQGDLGRSFVSDAPVASLLAERAGPTLSLATVTLTLALAIALPLGLAAAARPLGAADRVLSGVAAIGFSTPGFVLGYALVAIFALQLGWLPVQGYRPLSSGLWDWLRHLVTPCLSLLPVFVAVFARITRASVREALMEDYVRTARAKGLGEAAIVSRHALPNAASPILAVVGVGTALLVSGIAITENVFNIPGLGRLALDSALAGDFPVVQAMMVVSAATVLVVNLSVDVAHAIIDRRVRA